MPKPTLGVIFHPGFSPASLPEYAHKVEKAGFSELWLWDDCFLPGALTCAAIALSATRRLKVGIGLIPATAYNPLFAAMEISSLARAFPGRILPGFGHGVSSWMTQIGAAPKSSLKNLDATVLAVRQLLAGEMVSSHVERVNLEKVQMTQTTEVQPPLFVGAMREKTLRLAGRLGDGTLLTGQSSPAYVRWALKHIQLGLAESGRSDHRVAVFVDTKVNPDGAAARAATRLMLAKRLPWADIHLETLGITQEVAEFVKGRSVTEIAAGMPDAWVDAFTAAGTPAQVLASLQEMASAGADSIIIQPLDGDSDCLAEYVQFLAPSLKELGWLEPEDS
jgi:5,10-methylenetetrahydromethanopterin reductase